MWATILSSSVCFIWSGVLLYMVASTYDPIPTWLYIIVLLLRIFMIFIIINVVFSVYTLIYNLFSKSKKRLLDSN